MSSIQLPSLSEENKEGGHHSPIPQLKQADKEALIILVSELTMWVAATLLIRYYPMNTGQQESRQQRWQRSD